MREIEVCFLSATELKHIKKLDIFKASNLKFIVLLNFNTRVSLSMIGALEKIKSCFNIRVHLHLLFALYITTP